MSRRDDNNSLTESINSNESISKYNKDWKRFFLASVNYLKSIFDDVPSLDNRKDIKYIQLLKKIHQSAKMLYNKVSNSIDISKLNHFITKLILMLKSKPSPFDFFKFLNMNTHVQEEFTSVLSKIEVLSNPLNLNLNDFESNNKFMILSEIQSVISIIDKIENRNKQKPNPTIRKVANRKTIIINKGKINEFSKELHKRIGSDSILSNQPLPTEAIKLKLSLSLFGIKQESLSINNKESNVDIKILERMMKQNINKQNSSCSIRKINENIKSLNSSNLISIADIENRKILPFKKGSSIGFIKESKKELRYKLSSSKVVKLKKKSEVVQARKDTLFKLRNQELQDNKSDYKMNILLKIPEFSKEAKPELSNTQKSFIIQREINIINHYKEKQISDNEIKKNFDSESDFKDIRLPSLNYSESKYNISLSQYKTSKRIRLNKNKSKLFNHELYKDIPSIVTSECEEFESKLNNIKSYNFNIKKINKQIKDNIASSTGIPTSDGCRPKIASKKKGSLGSLFL